MSRIQIDQIHRLKFNEGLCTCDVCGVDVGDFSSGKGDYVLCDDHNNWRGWFKARKLDRDENRGDQ